MGLGLRRPICIHSPAWSSPGEGSIPSTSRTPSRSCPDTPASCHPPGSPPSQGRAYLSDTAGVVLGLGGGPEQAGGHRRWPQLQGPTEVRGVGGGSSGGGGRRRAGLLALGGQAELLGSPGEGRGGEGRGGRRGEGGEGRRGGCGSSELSCHPPHPKCGYTATGHSPRAKQGPPGLGPPCPAPGSPASISQLLLNNGIIRILGNK